MGEFKYKILYPIQSVLLVFVDTMVEFLPFVWVFPLGLPHSLLKTELNRLSV